MRGAGQHAVTALLGLGYIVTGVVVLLVLLSFRPTVPAGPFFPSPLQLAAAYSAMVNGGTLWRPTLGWAVVKKPEGVTAMLSPGTYGHGGAFGTQAWLDPERDLFMVLLIQRVGLPNADGSELRRTLQQLTVDAIKK